MHMLIYVTNVAAGAAGGYRVGGEAHVDVDPAPDPIGWQTDDIAFSATSSQAVAAIDAAARAAADAAGHVVGGGDNVTIIGGVT